MGVGRWTLGVDAAAHSNSGLVTVHSRPGHDTGTPARLLSNHACTATRPELAVRLAAGARRVRDRCRHGALVPPRGLSRRLQLVPPASRTARTHRPGGARHDERAVRAVSMAGAGQLAGRRGLPLLRRRRRRDAGGLLPDRVAAGLPACLSRCRSRRSCSPCSSPALEGGHEDRFSRDERHSRARSRAARARPDAAGLRRAQQGDRVAAEPRAAVPRGLHAGRARAASTSRRRPTARSRPTSIAAISSRSARSRRRCSRPTRSPIACARRA